MVHLLAALVRDEHLQAAIIGGFGFFEVSADFHKDRAFRTFHLGVSKNLERALESIWIALHPRVSVHSHPVTFTRLWLPFVFKVVEVRYFACEMLVGNGSYLLGKLLPELIEIKLGRFL